MGIVYACVAPHGSEAVPELAGDKLEAFGETRKDMLLFKYKQKRETDEWSW